MPDMAQNQSLGCTAQRGKHMLSMSREPGVLSNLFVYTIHIVRYEVSALALGGICSSATAHVLPVRAPLPPPPPPLGYSPPPPKGGSGKPSANLPVSHQSTCQGSTYINRGLVAFGTVASNTREEYGDTLGGFGSAIAADPLSFCAAANGSVSGTLFTASDCGWNTEGSIDYQTRIHRNTLTFTPTFARVGNGTENLQLDYLKSTLISKGDRLATGLDADYMITASSGFPDLPAGKRANGELSPAIDLEGMVWLRDGSFYISEEYGPHIYHIGKDGQILQAIRPPISFIPFTDGEQAFTSGNPPVGSETDDSDDPDRDVPTTMALRDSLCLRWVARAALRVLGTDTSCRTSASSLSRSKRR